MAEDRQAGAFIFGVVLGAIAGAAVTLWSTPRSGVELRNDLRRRAQELLGQVEMAGSEVLDRVGLSGMTADMQAPGGFEDYVPPATPGGTVEPGEPVGPVAESQATAEMEAAAPVEPEPVEVPTEPMAKAEERSQKRDSSAGTDNA